MALVKYTAKREAQIKCLKEASKNGVIDRQGIIDLFKAKKISWPEWLTGNRKYRAGRGMFLVPDIDQVTKRPSNAPTKQKPVRIARNRVTDDNAVRIANMPLSTEKYSVPDDGKLVTEENKYRGWGRLLKEMDNLKK